MNAMGFTPAMTRAFASPVPALAMLIVQAMPIAKPTFVESAVVSMSLVPTVPETNAESATPAHDIANRSRPAATLMTAYHRLGSNATRMKPAGVTRARAANTAAIHASQTNVEKMRIAPEPGCASMANVPNPRSALALLIATSATCVLGKLVERIVPGLDALAVKCATRQADFARSRSPVAMTKTVVTVVAVKRVNVRDSA